MRAGWAFAVSVSSSAGPSNIRPESFCDSAASTSSRTARACGKASASALPMPTAWLPCPGNTNARAMSCRPVEAAHVAKPVRQVKARPWNVPRPVEGFHGRVPTRFHDDGAAIHRRP